MTSSLSAENEAIKLILPNSLQCILPANMDLSKVKALYCDINNMLKFSTDTKLYLYLPSTDMRKSIDTLCILVAEQLALNPSDGHIFVFRNKAGNKIKCLYYEPNCFSLWYRRLDRGKFIFPKDKCGHIETSKAHFEWLLASDKYTQCGSITSYCENFF